MEQIKSFIKTSLIGGFIVILPVVILIGAFTWIFNFIIKIIQPLTDILVVRSDLQEIVAHVVVIILILLLCFVLGILVKTSIGKFFYSFIENALLKKIPGYSLVKETVLQFLGNKQSPFSSVALVNIFGNETLVTAFITDTHDDGSYSVFVPTGPNPTSGNIYHLNEQYVHKVDVPVEDTMRSIISCGSGSGKLVEKFNEDK
jgi:uncharacterized membrane protein